MNCYESEGHRKIKAESFRIAAETFAYTKALRLGGGWRVVGLKPLRIATDESSASYKVLLGTRFSTKPMEEWLEISRC